MSKFSEILKRYKIGLIIGLVLIVSIIVIIVIVQNIEDKPINDDTSTPAVTSSTLISSTTDVIESVPSETEEIDAEEKTEIQEYLVNKYQESDIEIKKEDTVDTSKYVYCKDKEGNIFTIVKDEYGNLLDTYAYYKYADFRKEWEKRITNTWFTKDRDIVYFMLPNALTNEEIKDGEAYIKYLDNSKTVWYIITNKLSKFDIERLKQELRGNVTVSVYVVSEQEQANFEKLLGNEITNISVMQFVANKEKVYESEIQNDLLVKERIADEYK